MQPRIVEVREGILKKNDLLARELRERFRGPACTWRASCRARDRARPRSWRRRSERSRPRGGWRRSSATSRPTTTLGASSGPACRCARSRPASVCHLEAQMVTTALEGWDLAALDLLFVENVGNLVCPSSYDLGEDLRVVLMSVTEGEDKPLKYPTIFNSADLAILTKVDLAAATGFDRDEALRSIEAVRPGLEVLETSARTGVGMDRWLAKLESLSSGRREARAGDRIAPLGDAWDELPPSCRRGSASRRPRREPRPRGGRRPRRSTTCGPSVLRATAGRSTPRRSTRPSTPPRRRAAARCSCRRAPTRATPST